MNFLKKIGSVFKKVPWKKVGKAALIVADILPYAHPAVQLVSTVTNNKTLTSIDKLLTGVLKVPQTEIPFNPNKEYTTHEINGILMAAANYAIRGDIKQAIEKAGSSGLLIAGQRVKTVNEIPDSVINTAVNMAYMELKEKLIKK